jgi:RNA polymerase sigma-54 factor
MALEQKLSLKLTQKLVMTPSLQQAIKLLQMTRMELQSVLAQELVENPLLEEAEEVREEEVSEAEGEGKEKEAAEQDRDESLADLDLESYFGNVWEGPNDMPPRELREAPPLENTLTREPDLYDHLLWQLHMSAVDGRQRRLCELIIGNLNPDGFLMASLDELQRMGEQ